MAHGSVTNETIARCSADNCVTDRFCCPARTRLCYVCDANYSLVGFTSTFCNNQNSSWIHSIGNCEYNPPSEYILYFLSLGFEDYASIKRIGENITILFP